MKKRYFLFPVLILLIGILVLVNRQGKYFEVKGTPSATVLQSSNNSKVEYICEKGKSAFDVLDKKFPVKSSDSNLGKLVTAINGVEQGNGKYWLYSINEKEATVGASSYVCQDNEKISWELK